MASEPNKVGIFVFDEVEVLDFAGPFEVFSIAGRRDNLEPFDVYTVSERPGPILARNGLSINPRFTFADCPPPDILVVPGGFGTRREMNKPAVVSWVRLASAASLITFSVCTGSLILATAGLLEGLAATTHHRALDELRAVAPHTRVVPGQKVVDTGRIVTSGGISAGINGALSLVGRLMGDQYALEAAHYMEYDWIR
ncbi:MAG: DJ-1/PfpI family protein [Gemmatimonadota bacterium]